MYKGREREKQRLRWKKTRKAIRKKIIENTRLVLEKAA